MLSLANNQAYGTLNNNKQNSNAVNWNLKIQRKFTF